MGHKVSKCICDIYVSIMSVDVSLIDPKLFNCSSTQHLQFVN